jgi:hypothetical protein
MRADENSPMNEARVGSLCSPMAEYLAVLFGL